MPRVGNVSFVRWLARLSNLRIVRVSNENEPIPKLAFWLPAPGAYRHPRSHVVRLDRGLAWCFPPGWMEPYFHSQAIAPFYLPNWQVLHFY